MASLKATLNRHQSALAASSSLPQPAARRSLFLGHAGPGIAAASQLFLADCQPARRRKRSRMIVATSDVERQADELKQSPYLTAPAKDSLGIAQRSESDSLESQFQVAKIEANRNFIRMEREQVIGVMKSKLVLSLAALIENEENREDFFLLCKRVESTVRAWYYVQFEEAMQLYSLFEPGYGAEKLAQQEFTDAQVDALEQRFLRILFKLIEKSNFKIVSDEEIEVADSDQYLVNLKIEVDTAKLDTKLLTKYFSEHPQEKLPQFSKQYILFRRGIGVDKTTDWFLLAKVDNILSRLWHAALRALRLESLDPRDSAPVIPGAEEVASADGQSLYVQRTRIENMALSLKNLVSKTTIQEPAFRRIILLYRPATPVGKAGEPKPPTDRSIHVKHFRNIPMADLDVVLPEKKNPRLTTLDWSKIVVSAVIGLGAVVGSVKTDVVDIRVGAAILSALVVYCARIYLNFNRSLRECQSLITRSMYDKQLDTGKGTLLHLCDDVIQQEVKEGILAYYVLMSQGPATEKELDLRVEKLLLDTFKENTDFEVDDAVQKMEKLGLVSKDAQGKYSALPLRQANEILGVTPDEFVDEELISLRPAVFV